MICKIIPFILMLFFLPTQHSYAKTYHIGLDQLYKTLKPIVSGLKPGDIVEIEPGTYREVMKVTCNGTKDNPIVIRGVGNARPVFDAKNLHVSGIGSVPRAIFQIEGEYIILENLEMKHARNGNNGAGIRLNHSKYAIIRNCKISDCDMGIQGGDIETALIEYCDIGYNGTEEYNGFSHNFYMDGNSVIVRNCFIHDSIYGQNFKSRAHYNELWYNWIVNSNEGEVGPVDGRGETDKENSNVLMVGNVIISKPNRTGNTSKYILMGSELGGSHNGTLYLYHNILVAGNQKNVFIQLDDPLVNAEVHYNVFVGSNQILKNNKGSKLVKGSRNWLPRNAQVPDGFLSNHFDQEPKFINQNEQDFRLNPDSPFLSTLENTVEYIDGKGVLKEINIDLEYLQSIRLFQDFSTGIHDFQLYEMAK